MSQTIVSYDRMSQTLHWVSAILIITMIILGLTMTRIGESSAQLIMFRTHVAFGLVVLVLTAIRLIWLAIHRWPPVPPGLSKLREQAFKWNHILLYLILIILLLSGVSMLFLSGLGLFPGDVTPEAIKNVPPRSAHILFSKIFILLLLMHLGGVLQYQFKKGDVFSRIGITWLSKYAPKKDIK